MAIRTILAYADSMPDAGARMALVASLARRHDARVVGLAVREPMPLPIGAPTMLSADVVESWNAGCEAAVAAARKLFDAAMAAGDRDEVSEWRTADGDPATHISLHGRYSDLIVVGQPNPEIVAGAGEELPDNITLESGRPVLVVPYIQRSPETGRHVVVAWNASREAARAVADAMPLLEKADRVTVLAANPNDIGDIPGADIAAHLARHGVRVEATQTLSEEVRIGDLLLNHVADSGADLLVMGAYGHSRFRETVLGGATRHIMRHMTVPTLLSH